MTASLMPVDVCCHPCVFLFVGAFVAGRQRLQPVLLELLLTPELELGKGPFGVLVQCRYPQREPFHRSLRRQQRRQVTAVAASDNGDRVGIDIVLRGEKVVGREDVAQALLTRNGLVL